MGKKNSQPSPITTDTIISKVWSFCNTLRDDGVGYGDYLGQLTYLILLKMADQYGKTPYNREVGVPSDTPGPSTVRSKAPPPRTSGTTTTAPIFTTR